MKRLNSFAVVLVLTVGAFLFGSANQSGAGQSEYYSRGGDGILRIKHSPVLGLNIPISVWIDGQLAGGFAKGHVFERALAPGTHTLYARRPGRPSDSFYGTLDVRAGETYSFIVKCNVDQVFLEPVTWVR